MKTDIIEDIILIEKLYRKEGAIVQVDQTELIVMKKYAEHKIAKFIENNYCKCSDSTGWTEWACCNICGKIVESEMKPKK